MTTIRVPLAARQSDDQVYRHLIEMLASGAFAPGAKLPAERVMAERLNVPRSAVRNAFAVLEARGAIVRLIGSGTFVAPPPPGLAPIAPIAINDASPTEIMEARLLIEPHLAPLAVAHATAADFERMEDCTRRSAETDTFEAFEHWDAALHQAIAEATHNRLIIELYGTITRARDQADWGELKRKSRTTQRRLAYLDEHRRIVAALTARDAAKAEAELLAHLRHVRLHMLGF